MVSVVQSAVKQEKQVSSKSTPTDLVTEADHQVEELIISTLREQYPSHRVIGSSTLALCHITSGAAEAYYQYGLHCWDIAAAAVIIREAGGYVIDTTGGALDLMSRRVVAAGTREIADYVLKQLQPINYSRDDLP
ncbi:inositol monophosphatase 2-like [Sinocyclocheilus anshuiensis]|uniref:inositol monophosphatase 2-like n=1 Tax=Sinocyclocheilus anshuiensis TaxID=1608454 RepID=UPI0007B92025|nr:PREDICTED: inositol monophosphatase 2-like [Sinocyclocheilus anshuiensis]